MPIPISPERIPDLVEFCKDEGKFFTIGFYKRSNGEYREINCRGRVYKGLSGGSLPYNPDEYNLITIYDVQDDQHKTIPVGAIVMVRAHGKEYRV